MSELRVTPDGSYYLASGAGQPVPRPYSFRWALPWVCGNDPVLWAKGSAASVALAIPAMFLFASGSLTADRASLATGLFLALPILRAAWDYPVLTDAAAWLLALLAAGLVPHSLPLAVAASVLAGAVHERAPVFAALWAWNPWLLLGVLACGWWRKAAPPDRDWLRHPIRTALAKRKAIGWDRRAYLLPWGACLVGLAAMDWRMAATLAVAYGQLLVAQDTARLYLWAAPVLCVGAASVLPWWLAVPAVLLTVAPRREGN